MRKLRTIILAAGKGTRMKSDLPKVLHELGGQPILQYILDAVKNLGSLKTYVVLGHQHEVVRGTLEKSLIPVIQKKLLGTADAVKCTQRHLMDYRGDVLVLCGDTPLLRRETLKRLIQKHRNSKARCTVLTAVMEQPAGYGRIIRQAGRAVAIREDRDADPAEKNIKEINVGVYCFDSKELRRALTSVKLNSRKKEFYLTDIVELFTQKGLRVETVAIDDFREGLGINNRVDLAFAEGVMRRRIIERWMKEGVTIIDPQTTYIAANVKIGRDTIIAPCTVIEGNVQIGKKCRIGPFARVRPGTTIGNQVEIGNFAEVSRAKIGAHTFIKHFSFLGDAVVGERVNIGAGAVTANFDGKIKNQTVIKQDAFIGSDSILVAPITVGRRAATGAGSVVTKGRVVPDGMVAAGMPARIISRRKF